MNLRKGLILISAQMLLGACALLGPHRDIVLYAPTLSAATSPAAPDTRSWLIEVMEPQALAPLLGTQMLVSQRPGQFAVYGGARWMDTPPLLLQALLVQGLHDVGIAGAGGSSTLLRADYILESDLRAFQAEYRSQARPTVVIHLDVRLIRVADGHVLAAHEFTIEELAASDLVPVVGSAFQRAVDHLVRDVSAWTHRSIETANPPSQ